MRNGLRNDQNYLVGVKQTSQHQQPAYWAAKQTNKQLEIKFDPQRHIAGSLNLSVHLGTVT